MAAAYGALMSLMHTSELILHPSQQWLHLHRKQIEALLQKVCFFQEFLEDYSHRGHNEMAGLESQIADTAYAAEDIIESHVLDQILARSTGSEAKSTAIFTVYIQKLIEEMEDLIETKVKWIKRTIGDFEKDKTLVDFSPVVLSRLAPNDQNNLVGIDEKLNEVMHRLTGQQSKRQIVTISGMAGIGKTTLARNVYRHQHIVHYFDIRVWATISPKYNVRQIILSMLSEIDQCKQVSVLSDDKLGKQLFKSKQKSILSDDQLGEQLHKNLSGMRYLIVMDDVWSTEVWDEIRAFFPDNCNGSRILITTRLLNVARQLSPFEPLVMEFLNNDHSWELLCDKVFGKESCPSKLEEIGKNIAIKCGGLPLAIVVIGGFLAKSNNTEELWMLVARNLASIINSNDDEKWLNILYWSYNNLPIHLKSCLLHMAAVPRCSSTSSFNVLSLLKVWAADGFLKPIRKKSLEEVAYEYMTDLIDRNLIFVHKREALGRLKTLRMHDLLLDLCLREARKENFLFVIGEQNLDIPLEIKFKRRLLFQYTRSDTQVLDLLKPASLTRSITSLFGWTISLASSIRLLRVLYVQVEEIPMYDTEIMQLINLRYMCIVGRWELNSLSRFTSSISQFWSLQTLSFGDGSMKPIFLPSKIWDLPYLRHLCFKRVVLPDPPFSDDEEHGYHILENLQILCVVLNFRCTKEVLKRAPNLETLDVIYDHLSPGVQWPYFCLDNLGHLHKLESLMLKTLNVFSLKYVSFPRSLKTLILGGCRLPWEDMTIVGSLPNLEMLKLRDYAFEGRMWCPIEGEFLRLKCLLISRTNLLHWRADDTHFPFLERLVLEVIDLEEIPRAFGKLSTLRKIKLVSCSDSTVASVQQILEEQEELGYEGLQLIVK